MTNDGKLAQARQCGTCRWGLTDYGESGFFADYTRAGYFGTLICVRYPPLINAEGGSEFPEVGKDWFCGEWTKE